jgi:hypothetical protein
MRLPTEFVRLPLKFDVERLSQEVLAFEEQEWLPHPHGFEGNLSIPLISLNGEMNDNFNGPMKATERLERSPYIQQVLASFDEVFGRSRLMGLAAGCAVPEHRDINYHWYNRVRIHVPVITNPDVLFYCGDTHVHMQAGETWIFDSWKPHRVENGSDENRVHLVIDTSGSSKFWQMVGQSEWRCVKQTRRAATAADRFIPFEDGKSVSILTEQFNAPLVMHPGEIDALVQDIVFDMRAHQANDRQSAIQFELMLQNFRCEWRRLWSLHGQTSEGWPQYENLINSIRLPSTKLLLSSNNGSAIRTFSARVLSAALNISLADQYQSD